jgi:nicotinamidase-related amidase
MKKALVIIDIQNDITKNYKEIIGNINKAIDWAVNNDIHVVYIRHENLSDGITSYDKRKIDEMLRYYESKGSKIVSLNDLLCQ